MQTQSGKGNDGANTRLIKRFSLNGEYISNGAASAVFHDDPELVLEEKAIHIGDDIGTGETLEKINLRGYGGHFILTVTRDDFDSHLIMIIGTDYIKRLIFDTKMLSTKGKPAL